MSLVVCEVQSKCILFIKPKLLVRHIVVPPDKVDGVTKVVSISAVISRATLIPFPRTVFSLGITVGIGGSGARDHTKQLFAGGLAVATNRDS